MPLRPRHRLLGLEALENRTLLAGGADLFADFTLTKTALSGTDYNATFSTNFGNHQLVLTGNSSSVVTIDLDKLPDFITNVRISSFSSVNFVGTDKVENLILTDIGNVNAPQLTVTGTLTSDHVGSITLGAIESTAVLTGGKTVLNVASLQDTLIISDLNQLTIGSQSKSLYFLSLNDSQVLNLTYAPEIVAVSGLPTSSVHVVLPGSGSVSNIGPSFGGDNGIVLPPVTGVGTDPIGNFGTGNRPGTGIITDPIPGGPGVNIGTGGSNPDIPASTQVVVVSLPADERTRLFIAELRELLHSTSGDSLQLVTDLVNHSAPTASLNGLVAPRVSNPLATPSALRVEVDGHLIELQGTIESEFSTSPEILLSSLTGVPHGPDGDVLGDHPLNLLPSTNIVSETLFAPNINVSLSVPDATAVPVTATEHARPTTSTRDHDAGTTELGATVVALGSYLVDRVSAEFSPGHQSIVLLVDPKSSRTANPNRSLSALDLFAQGATTVDGYRVR